MEHILELLEIKTLSSESRGQGVRPATYHALFTEMMSYNMLTSINLKTRISSITTFHYNTIFIAFSNEQISKVKRSFYIHYALPHFVLNVVLFFAASLAQPPQCG